MLFAGKGEIPVGLQLGEYFVGHRALHFGFSPISAGGFGNGLPIKALLDTGDLSNALLRHIFDGNEMCGHAALAERMGYLNIPVRHC